jgi:phage shock protein PspC (stress-responsive transcriptional regulator)
MACAAGPGHDRIMARKNPAPESDSTADSTPGIPAAVPPPSGGSRFFGWLRDLHVPRQPGWIGGVCAGIATRLGIDPLIVRGIVVVVAVLGGPALLLYAAAWLLLPDHAGKIHLEQLIKGRLESPIAGIGVMVLLSIMPVTQGFWSLGAAYWGEPSWGATMGRVLWSALVLAAIVGFVIWLALRSSGSSSPLVTPATTDDRPETIPHEPSTSSPAAAAAFTLPEPIAPAADAPQEDVAAWREQQAAWKAERESFRRDADAAAREANRRLAEEARARQAAAAAVRAENRRRWHVANPRAGAAYSAIALGAAALAGGISTLLPATAPGYEVTVGLAVAAITLALAITAAGLFRRRSGFLVFVSVVLVLGTLGSAAVPRDRELLPLGGSYSLSNGRSGDYLMPAGYTSIGVYSGLDAPGSVIDLHQLAGYVSIHLDPGTTTRVEIVTLDDAPVRVWSLVHDPEDQEMVSSSSALEGRTRVGDEWHYATTIGTGETPDATIRVWLGAGSISIDDQTAVPTQEMQP